MARTNGVRTEHPAQEKSAQEKSTQENSAQDQPVQTSLKVTETGTETGTDELENTEATVNTAEPTADTPEGAQDIDESLNALKALLTSVEKLQKVRQEVGDIKPLVGRMLDGELISGEELEQLKTGVGGLFRLVRAYGDHQAALAKAQPARSLLDRVLNLPSSSS